MLKKIFFFNLISIRLQPSEEKKKKVGKNEIIVCSENSQQIFVALSQCYFIRRVEVQLFTQWFFPILTALPLL